MGDTHFLLQILVIKLFIFKTCPPCFLLNLNYRFMFMPFVIINCKKRINFFLKMVFLNLFVMMLCFQDFLVNLCLQSQLFHVFFFVSHFCLINLYSFIIGVEDFLLNFFFFILQHTYTIFNF